MRVCNIKARPRGLRHALASLARRVCHEQHQNCRSMVVAPDGRIQAQAELKREELLVADIDISRATQAMFKFDTDGCAKVLFADTVARGEYAGVVQP